MRNGEITADAAGTWTLGDRVVNRMGFGSMRLTARPDTEGAMRVLRRAVDLGVDHIDTAAFYFSPGGILEVGEGPLRYATELIRAALSPYPPGLLLATKVGPWVSPSGGWGAAETAADLRRQVEENLRRLSVDRLDLVNLRLTRRGAPVAARFEALAAMRAEGLIAHLGLSNATIEQVDEASRIAPVVCVQNSYALDLRRDDDLVGECARRGIAFVPFFAIAGMGREAGAPPEPDARPAEDAPPEPDAPPQPGVGSGEAVRRVAAGRGVTPHQVRLAWTLHRGPHVLAIPGTGSERHLVENVAAGALRLTPAELALLG